MWDRSKTNDFQISIYQCCQPFQATAARQDGNLQTGPSRKVRLFTKSTTWTRSRPPVTQHSRQRKQRKFSARLQLLTLRRGSCFYRKERRMRSWVNEQSYSVSTHSQPPACHLAIQLHPIRESNLRRSGSLRK